MAAHDFDEIDNDFDGMDLDNIDTSSLDDLPSVTDLEIENDDETNSSLEKPLEKEEYKEEDENNTNELTLSAPPSDNAVDQAIKTFNEIYSVNIQLSKLAKTTQTEVEKLLNFALAQKGDTKLLLKDYETIHKRLEAAVKETQKYFLVNNNILKDIENIRNSLNTDFESLNKEIKIAQEDYKKEIIESSQKIESMINSIISEVNIDPIIKKVNRDIGNAVKESSLIKVSKTLEEFNNVYIELEEIGNKLLGPSNGEKLGLLEDFKDVVNTLDKKITNTRKSINWFGFIMFFILGVCVSFSFTYFYITQQNKKDINKIVMQQVEQSEQIHKLYKDKIDSLEKSNKAYMDFSRRFGIDNKNYGFDYFEDVQYPYFYYSSDAPVFKKDGKTYIKLIK